MPSVHFTRLATAALELKDIYLKEALAAPVPTPEHQELARAFVVLIHSELEYYVEEALRELAGVALNSAVVGAFSRASIALLAFSGMASLHGGSVLSTGKRKIPRRLASRFGDAHGALVKTLDKNNGVREKNIAAMAIPLGLDAASIDNTWLNDLDAFCSSRGAFAHMSRSSQRGSHLAVNPRDEWTRCERLIWTDPMLANPLVISSFESFDRWIEDEKMSFGPIVTPPWRLRVLHLLMRAIRGLRRKDLPIDDED